MSDSITTLPPALERLRQLVASGSTGELSIQVGHGHTRVHLFAGRLLWASDPAGAHAFNDELIERSGIDAHRLGDAVDYCRQQDCDLAQYLVEHKLATRDAVTAAREHQLQKVLEKIVESPPGDVTFSPRNYTKHDTVVSFELEQILTTLSPRGESFEPEPKSDTKKIEENQMSLDTMLMRAQQAVPECVAVGYVDMTTGMLLGAQTVEPHPQDVLDLVAAATADLFQGQNVTAIERMFRKTRGRAEDGQHYFREIIVFSENLIHVFLRCKLQSSQAVVYVCRATANIGMVLAKTRSCLADIESSAV